MADQFVYLCRDGNVEGVKKALQRGFDVNSKGEFGLTGLMVALYRKHTSIAILLLEQEDIDVNIVNERKQSALHFAAEDGQNSECLAMLLARTTSVNGRD